MKAPRLDLEQYVVEDKVDEAVITHKASGQTWVLDTADATFLRCIDGEKSVAQIREELGALLHFEIPRERLWRALDTLADIGVLAERLTPPATNQVASRRSLLRLAATSTVVAGSTVAAPAYANQEQDDKRAAEQDQKRAAEQAAKQGQEQNQKEQQQKQAAEAQAKQQAEQNLKNGGGPSEQDQKAAAEQQEKNVQAEQNLKQQAEQNQKAMAAEQNAKEAAVKGGGGGGGGGGPTPVAAPAALPLLGLGAAALALLRRRDGRIGDED